MTTESTPMPSGRRRPSRNPSAQTQPINPLLRKGNAGDEYIEKTQAENAARKEVMQNQHHSAFRFKLKQPPAGKSSKGRIIILDDNMDSRVTLKMHEIYNDGSLRGVPKMNYETCISETGNCPHCDGRNPLNMKQGKGGIMQPAYGSIVVHFSVLELHPNAPYTTKRGDIHTFSRRILAIKSNLWPDMYDILSEAYDTYGTLRGVVLDMERFAGSGLEQPAIGRPQKIVTPKHKHRRFARYSEEKLVSLFGSQEILKDDGSVYAEKNQMITPFDYNLEFPYLDEAQICAKYGIAPPADKTQYSAGAAAAAGAAATAGFDDDFGSDDDIPMTTDENGFSDSDFDDFDDDDGGDGVTDTPAESDEGFEDFDDDMGIDE